MSTDRERIISKMAGMIGAEHAKEDLLALRRGDTVMPQAQVGRLESPILAAKFAGTRTRALRLGGTALRALITIVKGVARDTGADVAVNYVVKKSGSRTFVAALREGVIKGAGRDRLLNQGDPRLDGIEPDNSKP